MRQLSLTILTIATLLLPAAAGATSAEGVLPAIGGARFIHVATVQNTIDGRTFLNHPSLFNDPSVILLVTQRYGTPDSAGVYNDRPIGVVYDAKYQIWFIRNEDATDIPAGAAFDVLAIAPGANASSHLTTGGNTSGNSSSIAESAAPGVSDLLVWITSVDTGDVTYHDWSTGVWLDSGKWSIYNEDGADMALGHSFNVAVTLPGARSVVHAATAENSIDNRTYIDHVDLNGRPGAWLLATHNWSPDSVGASVYADLAFGVWYDPEPGRWAIFDQAGGGAGEIPVGAAFNLLIDPNPSIFADDFESAWVCFWSSSVGGTACK